jgi:zinc protease
MKTPCAAVGLLLMLGGSTLEAAEDAVPMAQVVQLPVANDPTVSFRLWFKVGSQNDPPGKEGLAALTAAMLTEAATLTNSYEQVLARLYPLAASYSASTDVEMTVLSGRTHRDNLAEYYPLLIDAVLRPAFVAEDLERLRSEALNYLETTLRYADDEELGKAVLTTTVYAGTPYGHLPLGTVRALRSITLDDVRSFYRSHYTRESVVIGIGGSYDQETLERLRRDLFTLPAGEAPAVGPPEVAPQRGFRVTIVEKDAPATAISMGFPITARRGSRDWYALAIANSWLGEHRNQSSHLFQVIREARGLNYGDYSYIEHFPRAGQRMKPPQNVGRRQQMFEIWIRPVPNETRHFALRAALREFKRLVEKGMSREDFELTRSFLKKYVLHYAPTTMERLGYALDDRFYGIDGSHLERFRAMMDELTLDDVNAAIRRYWQYGSMEIAIVTKGAEDLRRALLANRPSPIRYSMPKPESVLSEDSEIMRFPIPVRPAGVRILQVGDLFER